jgi:excisionase family DNA binding protein
MTQALSREELLALPPVVDVRTAGKALGIGETVARELIRSGEWPTRVLRLGRRYRIRRTDLLRLLEVDDGPGSEHSRAGPAPPGPATAATDAPQASLAQRTDPVSS